MVAVLGGTVDETKLKEILLRDAYSTPEDIAGAEGYAHEKKIQLSDALLAGNLLSKDLLGRAVASLYGVTYADHDALPTDRIAVQKIPEEIARDHNAVYLGQDNQDVRIASSDPTDALVKVLAPLFVGKTLSLYYTLPEFIEPAFRLYQKPLDTRFDELFTSEKVFAPEVVDNIVESAVDLAVSDIHFEPRGAYVVVRFRIDGLLHEIAHIPTRSYENILNRIKILAHLPIDEHFRAQDGSFRQIQKKGNVHVRVSIAPTIAGEKIALRVLSEYMHSFTVETLGLSPVHTTILTEAARKPFGMILVTGPTGSGKTTTLYAFLNTLNTPERNITTIEDPVEYTVEGINQMQTNVGTDLTFARGLRSVVRQDPDIVLVGEIRDRETAEIAVNAALTGHLLFSTFHSNDAATAIPRLLDMGVEPFLLGSTLELVVAQRLVRRICENCRTTYTLTKDELRITTPKAYPYFKEEEQVTLYRGKGCEVCHDTGYRGRTGIFEILASTPEMQDLIATRPNRQDVWALARTQGATSLFEDGLAKVKDGTSTLEELLRVATPDPI